MLELHLLHPAAVHFPIALLTVGWAAAVAGRWRDWPAEAASWLLWLGTLAAWAAMGLGLLAESTAAHVPPAWRTVSRHETLAYWTVGYFTALALWRWRRGRRGELPFLILWSIGCGLILATAYYGGEFVFRYGMGVLVE